MTLLELSQHYRLREQLEQDEMMLESLQAAAFPKQVLSDMPRAPGIRDKVGDLAVEIADIESEIERLKGEIEEEEQRVKAFIESIADIQTRTILRLRFMRCMTWKMVANTVGGKNTERGVKETCYRIFREK